MMHVVNEKRMEKSKKDISRWCDVVCHETYAKIFFIVDFWRRNEEDGLSQ